MKRREFLQKSAFAAASAAAAAAGLVYPLPMAEAFAAESWTASLKNLSAHEGETLLKMARHLYPHDRLADSYYAKVATDLDAEAGKNPDTAKLLRTGVAGLDEGGKNFTALPAQQQLETMKKIESSPFFQKVRGTEVVSLYNNPAVWKEFGYAGPSYEFGGYLKHGFNDLKWLPDPPVSASPKPA
jgi:hypothetical protein